MYQSHLAFTIWEVFSNLSCSLILSIFLLLFEKPNWHQVLRYFSRDYGIGQWPDWDVGCKKAPAKVIPPKLGPFPLLFKGRWHFHPTQFVEVHRVPGSGQLHRLLEWRQKWAPGASQEHLVRCIDFTKPLVTLLVLEIWGNMTIEPMFQHLWHVNSYYEAFSYSCTAVWG